MQCIESCRYRRNALLLHVFYEQLQVNSYEQGASYTVYNGFSILKLPSHFQLVSLISDISGHAGLWLGISGDHFPSSNIKVHSVVSMVEILSLFVMIISNFVCGRNIVIDRENVEVRLHFNPIVGISFQREAEKRNERESREINSARVWLGVQFHCLRCSDKYVWIIYRRGFLVVHIFKCPNLVSKHSSDDNSFLCSCCHVRSQNRERRREVQLLCRCPSLSREGERIREGEEREKKEEGGNRE